MDRFVQLFIRSSVLWLAAGVIMGAAMAIAPELIVMRRTHVHANALGFITMMIFGVAYHVLPRFIGQPLWSRRAALWNLWASNSGVFLLVSGWLVAATPAAQPAARVLVGAGGLLAAAGALLFATNVWRTLDRAASPITQLRKAA